MVVLERADGAGLDRVLVDGEVVGPQRQRVAVGTHEQQLVGVGAGVADVQHDGARRELLRRLDREILDLDPHHLPARRSRATLR